MRISTQFLKSVARKPLKYVQYFDLSGFHLNIINGLRCCPNLQVLILANNSTVELENLEYFPQLWKVDLSNNKIRNLDGLCRFIALGSLDLSRNNLTWNELQKIQHMQILDLRMHGNPQLVKDTKYRIHMIDCLPKAWMVDGILVSSNERLVVTQFFLDSALTTHPVRHKLKREVFTPTYKKNLSQTCPYGERTLHFMKRFPLVEPLNSESDSRRLKYLAYNLQTDLMIAMKQTGRYFLANKLSNVIVELINVREEEPEKCHFLLLILMVFLEFSIPLKLIFRTLEQTNICTIRNIPICDLFLLNPDELLNVCSLLVSAVKLDKDSNQDKSGLYNKLYLSLYFALLEMIQKRISSQNYTETKLRQLWVSRYAEPCQLLASEAVVLFAMVPNFYSYIGKDAGVARILILATGDADFVGKVTSMMQDKRHQEKNGEWGLRHVSDYITEQVYQHHSDLRMQTSDLKPGHRSFVLMASKALPRKPVYNSVRSADHLHQGVRSAPYTRLPMGSSANTGWMEKTPALGDCVLTEPQVVGRITCLPEPYVAEIQMDAVLGNNSCLVVHREYDNRKHYIYVDLSKMEWDEYLSCWKPQGAKGDRITLKCPGGEQEADEMTQPGYEGVGACGRLKIHRKIVKQSPPSQNTSKTETSLRPLSASIRDKMERRIDPTGKADSILKMDLWILPEMAVVEDTVYKQSGPAEADTVSKEGISEATQADAQVDDKWDEGTQLEPSHCERRETVPLDTDLLRMGQATDSQTTKDCNIATDHNNLEVKHGGTDNLGGNSGASEEIKWMKNEDCRHFTQSFDKLFPRERYEASQKCKRLDSSSSYQESRIEGWKSGTLGTSSQRPPAKSAGYKVPYVSLEDRLPQHLSANNWLKDFSNIRPSTSKSRPIQTTYYLQQSGSYKKNLRSGCSHIKANNREQLKPAWARKEQNNRVILSVDNAQPSPVQRDKPEMSATSRYSVNPNDFLMYLLKSLIPMDSK